MFIRLECKTQKGEVGPRIGLDVLQSRKISFPCHGSNFDCRAPSLVTTPTHSDSTRKKHTEHKKCPVFSGMSGQTIFHSINTYSELLSKREQKWPVKLSDLNEN